MSQKLAQMSYSKVEYQSRDNLIITYKLLLLLEHEEIIETEICLLQLHELERSTVSFHCVFLR